MRPSQSTDSLETRIQYQFRNKSLLNEAMTHPSMRHDRESLGSDNQRLEFLGDAVLQLVLSETLYRRLPHCDEGLMTKLRTRLVSERALAKMARALELGPYLMLGRSVQLTGGRDRDSILSDALEALMGAVYLDGSLADAQSFILRVAETELKTVLERPVDVNPKGQLQELLQGTLGSAPSYELVLEEGPAHERVFSVVASWESTELGRGKGLTKKEAEVAAAAMALSSAPLKHLLRGAAS